MYPLHFVCSRQVELEFHQKLQVVLSLELEFVFVLAKFQQFHSNLKQWFCWAISHALFIPKAFASFVTAPTFQRDPSRCLCEKKHPRSFLVGSLPLLQVLGFVE